ncbi:MFS transporter [Arenibacter sp. GZD96]|uniref:MFS transporter n=1 Tax=Aurantibrevibacter litoralis TaxID=3106030 RepID=UPI002AFFE6A5|nr:MFS transporter [Arenibacter sp. GZD-96]MEA1787489.1 MFS transporter [Arenibacter sp. GZD-96]
MNLSKIKKIIAIYLGGYMTGVALVLFPAAGSIFTSTLHHGFSSSQFGSIFTPQIILAIISSLMASKLASQIGMKKVLLYGLFALVLSTGLLTASHWLENHATAVYVCILMATGFLGVGFGFSLTALNPFAFQLFAGKETSAITALHFFLGIGTATSPLLISYFTGLDMWWGASLVTTVILLLLLFFTWTLPLKLTAEVLEKEVSTDVGKFNIPPRLWWYIIAVFFYGACEATFGSWGAVFLEKQGGLSIAKASLGLSLFWGSVAVGRILFALMALKFKTNWLYVSAPFVLGLLFYLLPQLNSEMWYLCAMAVGGLVISFMLPKSFSNATADFPKNAALVSGFLVAALQLGTGFSANLIGFFNAEYSLGVLFQFSTVYALLFGALLVYIALSGTAYRK